MLITKSSSELSSDVLTKIKQSEQQEIPGSEAKYAMEVILENIELAKLKQMPICQDTGTISFYITHGETFDRNKFVEAINYAIEETTRRGILRQNSVDSITGINSGNNLGKGHPQIFYDFQSKADTEIRLMLKGGGCENVGAQYSLPNTTLNADRDLDGVKKVVLDSIIKAQGKGCGPGFLGVCIGGDRASSYAHAKKQLLRKIDDINAVLELKILEDEVLHIANKLGIGPMGFGGNSTLLGVKIGTLNRLPASHFVSISYMCWANRRQGIRLKNNFEIDSFLY